MLVRFGQWGPPGPLKPRPHTGYRFILPPLLLLISLLQTSNCPVNASSSVCTWAMFDTPAESLVSFIQKNTILCVLLLVCAATCIRVTISHLVLTDTSICTGIDYCWAGKVETTVLVIEKWVAVKSKTHHRCHSLAVTYFQVSYNIWTWQNDG